MPDRELMEALVGDWAGTSKLWLSPGEDPRESDSSARVSLVGQGQFVRIEYDWSFDKMAQDGQILFAPEFGMADCEAVWLDSWHMASAIMTCEVSNGPGDSAILRGNYPAPPDPDWGWRIEIRAAGAREFEIRMFNISPEGEEALAVQATYRPGG